MLEVSTEESFDLVKRLAKEEGLFAGVSSGAALAASLKLSEHIDSGIIVTIFADGGIKYLSDHIWD
jgi:cysteine synthase